MNGAAGPIETATKIIRQALGMGEYPCRNHYISAPSVDLERQVRSGRMVMVADTKTRNRYHVTMTGLAFIGVGLKPLPIKIRGDGACRRCAGIGSLHEIHKINDRNVPTFEVIDCPRCEGDGRAF